MVVYFSPQHEKGLGPKALPLNLSSISSICFINFYFCFAGWTHSTNLNVKGDNEKQ